MVDRTIRTVLTVDDRMSPALRNAAQSTTKLADGAARAGRSIDAASRSTSLLKAGLAGVAGGIALGGVDALVGKIGDSVSAASDLNETMSKSAAIFGSQQSAMVAWAKTADRSLGMSKAAALDAAASFGDMFAQLGFAGDQAAAMSRQVVQMSADLGSFNNMQTADVADRISAAFRGEYDSLQLLIPNISAARVEQQAMAMTGEASARSLTAQQKAAAVLAIVQQDGARAMGDFARTADQAANAQKTAQAKAADLAAEVGQNLLPAWTATLGFINNVGLPALAGVASMAGSAAKAVGELPVPIQAVGAAFITWKVAGPAIQSLATAAGSGVVGTVRSLGEAVSYAGAASQRAGGGFSGAVAGLRTFAGASGGAATAMGVVRSAGSGLMAMMGGPWGLAFAGGAAAIAAVGSAMQESKARTESMTQAIVQSGDAMSKTSREAVAMSISQSGLLKNLTDSGVAARDAVDAVMGLPGAYERVDATLNTGIIAHADYMSALRGQQGQFQEAKAAADQYKAGLDAAGTSADGAKSSVDGMTAAEKASADAAKDAAKATDEFRSAVGALGDTLLSQRDAARGYEAAIGAVDEALKKNGATLDIHSEKGRANQAALDGIAESGTKSAQAILENGGSFEDAAAAIQRTRNDFVSAATRFGMNKAAAEKLATQLGLTDAAVVSLGRRFGQLPPLRIIADNRQALTAIAQVASQLSALPGMGAINLSTSGLLAASTSARADGGVDAAGRYVPRRSQISRGGRYVLWAEDETRDEAYISRKPGQESRNLDILATAASWFGARVVQAADGALLSGTATLGDPRRFAGGKLALDVIAKIGDVIPPKDPIPLSFDLSNADKAMLQGPELVSLLTGIDLPEVEPAVKKVRDGISKIASMLDGLVKSATSEVSSSTVAAGRTSTTTAATSRQTSYSGALGSSKAKPYLAQILAMGAKYNVAPELIAAVIQQESGFNPNAGSSAGARGLMQLMPSTFRGLGVGGSVTNPNSNIEAGVKYLAQQLSAFGGNITKALQAYNAGPGAVKSGRANGYAETRNYVKRITADAGVKSLAGGGRYGSSAAAGVQQAAAVMTSSLAEQMIANAKQAIGTMYRYGGGHGDNTKATLGKTLVDCSGLLGVSLSKTLGKNVSEVSDSFLKGKNAQRMTVQDALRTRGAFVGRSGSGKGGHVAISLGDGTILEAPRTGKPVRIRKTSAKEWNAAAWDSRLGARTASGSVAGAGAGTVASKAAAKSAADAKAEAAKLQAQANAQAVVVDKLKAKLVEAAPYLEDLATQHAAAAEQAEKYKKELEDLTKAQSDYAASAAKSIASQGDLSKLWKYDAEAGVSTSLQSIIADREKLIEQTKAFMSDAGRLKAAGLNAGDMSTLLGTFQQDATAGSRMAADLLAGGAGIISDLNRTWDRLEDVTRDAGVQFGDVMYGSQVDAARQVADAWAAEEKGLADTAWQVGQSIQAGLLSGMGMSNGKLGAQTSSLLDQMKQQWLASLGITTSAPAAGGKTTAQTQPKLSLTQTIKTEVPQTMVFTDAQGTFRGFVRAEATAAVRSEMQEIRRLVGWQS